MKKPTVRELCDPAFTPPNPPRYWPREEREARKRWLERFTTGSGIDDDIPPHITVGELRRALATVDALEKLARHLPMHSAACRTCDDGIALLTALEGKP